MGMAKLSTEILTRQEQSQSGCVEITKRQGERRYCHLRSPCPLTADYLDFDSTVNCQLMKWLRSRRFMNSIEQNNDRDFTV